MVKVTKRSIGPSHLLLFHNRTEWHKQPVLSSEFQYYLLPSFINLDNIKSSYLSFLAWKQSLPCNKLLPGVFLSMDIIKIIMTKSKSSICCTQLAVIIAATFPSHPTKAAAPLFPSQNNYLSCACCCASGKCRGRAGWDYYCSGEKTSKVRRQHSV